MICRDRIVQLAARLALVLAVAFASASSAYAGDVAVTLDSGTGFVIENGDGSIERLRVDEATGNVSRNGALFVHTTGSFGSTFLGAGAGNLTTASGGNSAFGYSALHSTTGGLNTAVGSRTLGNNTTGGFNSAVGADALRYNTTGSFNSALGASALSYNTTGTFNSAVGFQAFHFNTTGSYNSAFGSRALSSNTTASGNSALGFDALASTTTGGFNSAVGWNALHSNTTGYNNAAVGADALYSNHVGAHNAAVGAAALLSNFAGNYNSALGDRALVSNTSGSNNSAVGFYALQNNSTGSFNSAVGDRALFQSYTGARNVAVGKSAGYNLTAGSDNIYLANTGVATESATIRVGCPVGLCASGATPHARAFVAGIRGVTTANANAIPVVIDSAGQLGTVSSSRSVKQDIHDMGDATARLLDLRPVTFRYKQQQALPGDRAAPPEYGLIAEEVAETFPDLVVYDEKGAPFTVKYHELASMLLNEMKKDRRVNADQQRKIDEQAGVIESQQREISALATRLARIESRGVPASD